ncbi:MAG: adenosylcobinamide-GDP ribazoletransferase [Pseudonocardiales bacterium]|jgi:adenosylcobinamide-GDP ribazoletransferase|nr:cobS [Pseudonocardiales bacterium]MDT4956836.1 adenosylcobinamide-GDP ribazoletransferase [Pseudonocardiales bacterium]
MRRAIAFLTPLGGAAVPDRHTLSWFPLTGAAIGAVIGGVWWATSQVWPAVVAAALTVVADLAITGLLHFDGLVDSADGLLPHLPRQRRLEVMAEPTVGAFGVAAAMAVILLRLTALASMVPSVLLIAGVWCGSRSVMAVGARALPYARPGGGLATAMLGGDWRPVAGYGVAGALALACLGDGLRGAVAVAAGIVAGTGVVLLGWRRLGGFTGDVLGAAGVIGETVSLVVAAATW